MRLNLNHVLPLLMVGSSLMTNGWAQRGGMVPHTSKPIVNMRSQGTGGISVSFVSPSDGSAAQRSLDLGSVSYTTVSRSSNVQLRALADRLVVSTKLGLDIQAPAQRFSSVTLMASLAYPDPNHVLWFDGMKLATTLQTVQGLLPVNRISTHRLEIEIPTSLTEKDAAVHNSIIVQVIPN